MDVSDRLFEQRLVLRCQAGDREAFQALMARTDRPLRYFVRRLLRDPADVDDVVQEVWLTVFRRIGALSHPQAFRSWLYRIANAGAVNVVRRGSAQRRAEQGFVEAGAGPGTAVGDGLEVLSLHDAIERLDSKHRAVMALLLVGELSVAEIAESLSIPPGTVKSRAHHAREQLREWMGGQDGRRT